jgi:hypothetical protein
MTTTLKSLSHSSLNSLALYNADVLHRAVYSTTLVLSWKWVRKSTLGLVKRPSLSETMMNWAPQKHVWKSMLMCCMWNRSSAVSILLRMYIGASLNCSSAMIRESAMSDLLFIPYICYEQMKWMGFGEGHTVGHCSALSGFVFTRCLVVL